MSAAPPAPAPIATSTAPAETARVATETCRVCGAPAPFGFGVRLLRGQAGRWACAAHRDLVERMAS